MKLPDGPNAVCRLQGPKKEIQENMKRQEIKIIKKQEIHENMKRQEMKTIKKQEIHENNKKYKKQETQ